MTDLGIQLDLRNPPRWAKPWDEFYAYWLDFVQRAEEAGLGSVWLSEHHFFEDGYNPQPLVFAAAVAARTKKLRIGTAIVLAPLRSPLHIAEEAAIVDIISGGRMQLGLGAGYRIPEFKAFDADHANRFKTNEQCVREIRRLWNEGGITPLPLQQEPPIWVGHGTPRGAGRAGRLGEGLLSLDPALFDAYCEGLDAAGHDRSRAKMAGAVLAVLSEHPDRDWPRIAPHACYYYNSYRRYGAEGTKFKPRDLEPDELTSFGPDGMLPSFIVATPEDLGRMLRERLAGLPIETIFFNCDVCGMPRDIVEAHLELLATRMPAEVSDLSSLPRPESVPLWQGIPGMKSKVLQNRRPR